MWSKSQTNLCPSLVCWHLPSLWVPSLQWLMRTLPGQKWHSYLFPKTVSDLKGSSGKIQQCFIHYYNSNCCKTQFKKSRVLSKLKSAQLKRLCSPCLSPCWLHARWFSVHLGPLYQLLTDCWCSSSNMVHLLCYVSV